jgi:cytochrome c6
MIKRVLSVVTLALAAAPLSGRADDAGPALYAGKCAACHLPDGKGIQGVFPALANSAVVAGSVDEVVRTILAGRGGMPSFKAELNDQDLTSVVNFLRTSLNKASPVTTDAIKALRASTSDAVVDERATAH